MRKLSIKNLQKAMRQVFTLEYFNFIEKKHKEVQKSLKQAIKYAEAHWK